MNNGIKLISFFQIAPIILLAVSPIIGSLLLATHSQADRDAISFTTMVMYIFALPWFAGIAVAYVIAKVTRGAVAVAATVATGLIGLAGATYFTIWGLQI